MQLVDNTEFLEAMKTAGIIVEAGWFRLSFGRYDETNRFWVWPWPPQDLASLLTSVLQHIAPTAYWDAWRPGGVWHEDDPSYTDSVREVLLRGFAIPQNHCGALRFDRSDAESLCALVLAFAVAGWNINDDLCLVPDNRRFIVRVSHHAVLHVECREPELVGPLVAHMASQGWELPREVPDPTFKIPSWMTRPDHEAHY
jgi:hypothetical protein